MFLFFLQSYGFERRVKSGSLSEKGDPTAGNSRGNLPRFRAIAYLHEQGADGDDCASNWGCVNIMILILYIYIILFM